MKITYVTEYDASDIHNWSGLGFNIAKALIDQRIELDYIGNLDGNVRRGVKIKKMVYKSIGMLRMGNRSAFVLRDFASQIEQSVDPKTDIIFSPSSLPLAMMKNRYSKVLYTDATFAGMLNFYEGFSNLSSKAIRQGNYLEQKALDNCDLAIYSSEWAARTAMDFYRVDPEKIKVVPFGANLKAERKLSDIEQSISNRSKSVCRLLFLAVEWKRKGGDEVIQIAHMLSERGLNVELHIAGLRDLPLSVIPPYVVNHGYISKATADGNSKIDGLFQQSHFLLLPSKADCSPVVLSEASSFGVPSVTTNVGGICSVINDGMNGMTFSLGTDIECYADYIQNHFSDLRKYEELALTSFKEYQRRLNWDVAGQSLVNLFTNLLATR